MKLDVVLHSFGGDRVYENATIIYSNQNPPIVHLLYTASNGKLVKVESTLPYTVLRETTEEIEKKNSKLSPLPVRSKRRKK